jgi:hypothetical protein
LFGGDSGGGGGQSYSQPAYTFKPYNVSTPFGAATFDTGSSTASYALSPELQAFRNKYYQAAALYPNQGQLDFANQVSNYGLGLFDQAGNLDTTKMTQDYYNQQQNILAPARAQEEARLADTLFKQGRTGAAIGMNQGYVNPEQYALLQARENQNAQLQLTAEDRARAIQQQQLASGLNYYGQGQQLMTQPFQTSASLLGLGTNLEALGSNALTVGSNIGTGQANAAFQSGSLGFQQQQEQNKLNAANAANWGNFASNVGSTIGKWGQNAGNNPFIFGGWGGGDNGGVSMDAGNYDINNNPFLNWGK